MTVAAPSQAVWWDVDATTTAVLAQLRLTDTDVDAGLVGQCVDAIGRAINNRLDSAADLFAVVPADVQLALQAAAIELYRTKDAGTSDPTDWAVAAVVTRYGSVDPLANVMGLLLPYRQRFGIG